MRIAVLSLALVLWAGAIDARPPGPAASSASASASASVPQTASSAASGRPIEQGRYVNIDGQSIHSPAHTVDGTVPAGASARCGDGSFSFSTHRRGTCSHHGGVAAWL